MRIPFFPARKNQPAPVPIASQNHLQMEPLELVLQYHERTKHHPHRFAASLGYLDWDNQPDPFRRFKGAPLFHLPLLAQSSLPPYEEMFLADRVPPQPLTVANLSRFFRNALAISAWKRFEDTRWALRVNPSSGNLHPTESYLVTGGMKDLKAGVYHYAVREHALEQRARFAESSIDYFLIGLTSIHWREAWKYGERAYRYCHHDLGHAISAVRLSAAVLGWKATYRQEFSESEMAFLLGLSREEDFHEAEDEYPECLITVTTSGKPVHVEQMFLDIESAEWQGTANRLSESHMEWEIVDEVAKAAHKPRTPSVSGGPRPVAERYIAPSASQPAEQIIQQRRSCLGLDAKTRVPRDSFFSILTRTLPERTAVPFDVFSESLLIEPRIHFALFVHRVDGIIPGLYFLIRNASSETNLKASLNPDFLWTKPVPDFPLYLLQEGDFTRISSGIACGQDLAGDGVFSLGMIAEFEESIRSTGPWLYPRLFWEAGLIGQVLYLEAEAAGIRGTGIGCYYDDPMHELLGIKTRKFQSLYHFTMGGPVDDSRLTTEPSYAIHEFR